MSLDPSLSIVCDREGAWRVVIVASLVLLLLLLLLEEVVDSFEVGRR